MAEWIVEEQQPDGSWILIAGPLPVRDACRVARRRRRDRDHLALETRVRQQP